MDGNEVSQLYIAVPPLPNVRTPIVSLQGFSKNFLNTQESKRLSFLLTAEQISTVAATGLRRMTKGTYSVYVGGHQPRDTKGEQVGNIVIGQFDVV